MAGQVKIGVSGWLYDSWRGRFYPPGLRHRDELAWVSRKVGTIEINGTFYSLQRPESFRSWRARSPGGFPFAVKGSRFISHMKKLRNVQTPLANFFASGVLALEGKLGPILWQFPASIPFDGRFEDFFGILPRTTREAARLARGHDERVAGRSHTRASPDMPIRYAIEVRHPSFLAPQFLELLRRENMALVVSDGAARWPLFQEVTADFVYVRLHGAEELYVSGYTPEALDLWADRVRSWRGGARGRRDVYVYFDNDAKVHAPFDAMALMDRLGIKVDETDLPAPLTGRRPARRPARARSDSRRAGGTSLRSARRPASGW